MTVSSEEWAGWVDRYGAVCGGLALTITGDRASAETVTSGAFLRVWHDEARPDAGSDGVGARLLAVTRRLALGAARRDGRPRLSIEECETALTSTPATPETGPTGMAGDTTQARHAIRAAVTELSVPQRRYLAAVYLGGYSCDELAAATDSSPEQVRSLLLSALRHLHSAAGHSDSGTAPV